MSKPKTKRLIEVECDFITCNKGKQTGFTRTEDCIRCKGTGKIKLEMVEGNL